MRAAARSALAAGGLLLATTARAQIPGLAAERPFTAGGYLEYRLAATRVAGDAGSLDQLAQLRLDLEYRPGPGLIARLGMRNRLLAGRGLERPARRAALTADEGRWDLTWRSGGRRAIAAVGLDRLYLEWRRERWRLRAGRHRVHWGMVTLWSPNDLFNADSIFDLDYAERPGSDALRVARELGPRAGAEALWVAPAAGRPASAMGRYWGALGGYDVQLLAGRYRRDTVAGAGFAGSLAGAALRGEASAFFPRAGSGQRRALAASLEASAGLGARRNARWQADLLYLSRPLPGAGRGGAPSARALGFARWNGYAEIALDLTALSRVRLGAAGYSDGSWYAIASDRISLADDWSLLVAWQRFDGSPESTLGAHPADLLFARLRWSF